MRCTVWLSTLRKCEPLVSLGKWLTARGTGREGERSKKGKRRILRVRLSWRNWEKAERKELVGPTPCLTVWRALLVCAGQHDLSHCIMDIHHVSPQKVKKVDLSHPS